MKNIKYGIYKLIFPLISLVLCLNIQHSNAYFYNSSTFENNLCSKDCSYNIYEIFKSPEKWDGSQIKKKLFIENISKSDTRQFVRFRYFEELISSNGDIYSVIDENGNDLFIKGWATDLNDTNTWQKIDGWYYYRYSLSNKDTLQILEYIKSNNFILDGATYNLIFDVGVTSAENENFNWDISFPEKISDNFYNWEVD